MYFVLLIGLMVLGLVQVVFLRIPRDHLRIILFLFRGLAAGQIIRSLVPPSPLAAIPAYSMQLIKLVI